MKKIVLAVTFSLLSFKASAFTAECFPATQTSRFFKISLGGGFEIGYGMTIYLGHFYQSNKQIIKQPIDIDFGSKQEVYRSLVMYYNKPNLRLTRTFDSNVAVLEIFNPNIIAKFKQDELNAFSNLRCIWSE